MCRIEERVYIRPDGHQSTFDETFRCERGRRHKRTCSDAEVHTTTYRTGASSHNTSSPVSSPITPGEPGFNTRERRPSTSSRPSTRDGTVKVKPEVVIEIGSKKGKGKGYPMVSISTKSNHRTSLGTDSVIGSPSSDVSQTIRTGYTDAPLPPFNPSYTTAGGLHPRPGNYRNPSSDESYTGSSRVPSLYRSDHDSPPSLATTTSSGTRPVIHNPSPVYTARAQTGSPSSLYNTTIVSPGGILHGTTGRTERDQYSWTSYAPEITGRDEDRRRRRDEKRRRQEALDAEIAASLVREENRRVHFEPSRTQHRADQRAEKSFAAHEQRRTDDRERLRQQDREEQEARAKEAAATRPRPTSNTSKSSAPSRRGSVRMTSAQAAEQQHLIAAEARQMQDERIKAEAIEREEQQLQQQPTLRQQQQDPRYYDPRGGSSTMPKGPALVSRRGSISGPAPRPTLGRSNSSRGSTANDGPRQDSSSRRNAPPPVSYYNSNPRTDLPPARERHPSSSHSVNLSAQPGPNQMVDPWDVRNVREALPTARGPQVGHTFPLPQQASHRMNQAFYGGEYETDSEDEHHGRRR